MQFIDICYKFCSLDSRSFRSCRGCFLMLCVFVCVLCFFRLFSFSLGCLFFFSPFIFSVLVYCCILLVLLSPLPPSLLLFSQPVFVCVRYVFFSSASRRNKKSNQIEIKSSKIRSERSFARALFDGINIRANVLALCCVCTRT